MGVVGGLSATEVSQLLNISGVDLILSDLLSSTSRFECPVCLAILDGAQSVYILIFLSGFCYFEQKFLMVWTDYI